MGIRSLREKKNRKTNKKTLLMPLSRRRRKTPLNPLSVRYNPISKTRRDIIYRCVGISTGLFC